MRESDIIHENGEFWVYRTRGAYEVMRPHQAGCSITDSAYEKNPDGLSIAIARCDYLAKRAVDKDMR